MTSLAWAVDGLWETEPEAVEPDTPAGTPTVKFLPTRTKRADALELLAESFLQNGAATLNGGDKHQIVVHVDLETLQNGCAGRCEIEHGTHIAAETVRRLACDASLVGMVENENGDPLSVGFDSVAPGHTHPIGDWRELPRQYEQQQITIDPRTAVTRWDGGPLDFGIAVDSLLRRWRNAKNPPRGGLLAPD